jgi:hypothetical protein
MACAMGEAEGLSCRFRRPFFGSFFGRTKKERKRKNKKSSLDFWSKQKKVTIFFFNLVSAL